MSNFKEVVKESIEKGIILDSCGEVERFYDYGRYIDLCGLNPKDIVENMQNTCTCGGDSSKTNVVINGVVTEENGEYYVVLNATSEILDIITISMNIDNKTQTVTMQPGSVDAKFGPVEKYCEIKNVTVTPQSTSVAEYSAKVTNPNGKGLFNVSVISVIDNEETLISTNKYKYKNIVKITASDIEGYNFINWDNGIETGDTINIEFEMPEHDVEVKCYYNINIKTFYYGTMYADQYTRVTEGDETIFEIDNDDLSIVEEPKEAEYIDNKKMTIEYLQPRMSQDKSSEYAKLRGTTEKANWIKNNGFVLYIAAPSDINNIVYEYDTDVYKDLNELSKTIKIDGNEYRQFIIDEPALPLTYDNTASPAEMDNKVIINYKK